MSTFKERDRRARELSDGKWERRVVSMRTGKVVSSSTGEIVRSSDGQLEVRWPTQPGTRRRRQIQRALDAAVATARRDYLEVAKRRRRAMMSHEEFLRDANKRAAQARAGSKAPAYSQAQLEALAKEGGAYRRNDNGQLDYPIGRGKNAVRDLEEALRRWPGEEDMEAKRIRAYIVKRCVDLGIQSALPKDWQPERLPRSATGIASVCHLGYDPATQTMIDPPR